MRLLRDLNKFQSDSAVFDLLTAAHRSEQRPLPFTYDYEHQ